jgi:NADH-quinone oxidoreductase subunit N
MTFTYIVTASDWGAIVPELVLAGMALLVMLVDLLLPHEGPRSKHSGPANFSILPLLSFVGVLGAIGATVALFFRTPVYLVTNGTALLQAQAFNNMVSFDQGTLYAYIIILSASGLGLLFSPAYLKRLKIVHQGEYYALYLLATVGMLLLAAATSFLVVFLGLEMLSLALYILCGFASQRKTSQEAGMKYFLLSSFASAFLLYGIALTYGATGSTFFTNVVRHLAQAYPRSFPPGTYIHAPTMLIIAMGLLAVGFAFKVSAIPFQAWTPDVYQGAPAPVTAFMSVGTKAAALIAFARVFDVAFGLVARDWLRIVWAITILTIIGGNVMALVQTNAKRLLAYSSIAHAGYLLIGVVVGGVAGIAAVLFYLLCYSFMNLGAFGVISMLERADGTGSGIQDLRGLWQRQPVLAGLLAFFLLALAGFPPMAGFAGKYYMFYTALIGGHPELLIIGVLASVLGMYYYLRVIATMFMEQAPALAEAVPATAPSTPNTQAATARRGPASAASAAKTATGGLASSATATAVAVKPATSGLADVAAAAQTEVQSEQSDLGWVSWVAVGLAAVGTLAMGTLLPFWLVALAQQAAQMMLR